MNRRLKKLFKKVKKWQKENITVYFWYHNGNDLIIFASQCRMVPVNLNFYEFKAQCKIAIAIGEGLFENVGLVCSSYEGVETVISFPVMLGDIYRAGENIFNL